MYQYEILTILADIVFRILADTDSQSYIYQPIVQLSCKVMSARVLLARTRASLTLISQMTVVILAGKQKPCSSRILIDLCIDNVVLIDI